MRAPLARLTTAAALLAVAAFPCATRAGIYGDDLARCLVANTSDADRTLLATWIFTVISVHPEAERIATIADEDREAVAVKAAALFEGLLTETCATETSGAVKYEGASALEGSFKTLGEIAMTTLLAEPRVGAASQNFIKYVDLEKIGAVVGGQPEPEGD